MSRLSRDCYVSCSSGHFGRLPAVSSARVGVIGPADATLFPAEQADVAIASDGREGGEPQEIMKEKASECTESASRVT